MRFYMTSVVPNIECYKCGIVVEAGRMSVNSWFHTTDEIRRHIEGKMPDIPFGWSSNGWTNGRRDLRCVRCS